MSELLSNPKAALALVCIGAFVAGVILNLVVLLRGNKTLQDEAAKWGQAFSGGRAARRRQEAQVDELHRLVSDLKAAPPAPGERPTAARDKSDR